MSYNLNKISLLPIDLNNCWMNSKQLKAWAQLFKINDVFS